MCFLFIHAPFRDYLVNFEQIGEGSTGVVYTADYVPSNQLGVDLELANRKVAIKKMNLARQQRRELLFNEVGIEQVNFQLQLFYCLDPFNPWNNKV